MANEVKALVKELITTSTAEEITVDDIFVHFADFDPDRNRVDVLNALRNIESEGLGVLAVGRRGKPTRFIKGAQRVKSKIDQNIYNEIEKIIHKMEVNEELIFDTDNSLKVLDILLYKAHDRAMIIEIFKSFQESGIGKFIIGRRGGKSRFVKEQPFVKVKPMEDAPNNPIKEATKEIEILPDTLPVYNESVPTQTNDNVMSRYNVINNIVFKCMDGGFSSLDELIKQNNLAAKFEPKIIEENLEKFGYFSLLVN